MGVETDQPVFLAGFEMERQRRCLAGFQLDVRHGMALVIVSPRIPIGIAGRGVVVLVGGEIAVQIERRARGRIGKADLDRIVQHRVHILVAQGTMQCVFSHPVKLGYAMRNAAAQGADHAPLEVEQAKLGAMHEEIERRLRADTGRIREFEGIDAGSPTGGQRLQVPGKPAQVVSVAGAACSRRFEGR